MALAVRKAIFPVAGLGTRFLPATRSVPKELLAVLDRPLIDYAVAEAKAAGIDTFIFVTGLPSSAEALRAHLHLPADRRAALGAKDAQILAAMEDADLSPDATVFITQDEPLGLGHAVWCARGAIGNEPFAVLLPDDLMDADPPAIGQLIGLHEETGGNVLACEAVAPTDTVRYGILDPGAVDGRALAIKGLVEKPAPADAPSGLGVIGRYVILPSVFDKLEGMKSGAGGEIQLTDALAAMIGEAPFHGLEVEGRRFDCGSKVGFIKAQLYFALKDRALRPVVLDHLKAEGGKWE